MPIPDLTQVLIEYGYSILFVAVLTEQIGLPIPSAPVLIAAGTLAGLQRLNVLEAAGLAVAACLISDSVWFYLGKRKGTSILGLLCKISLEPDTCVSKTRGIFSDYGPWALLIAKFVPGLNTIAPPMAGMFKLAWWRFITLDTLGAALWAGAYISVGWVFRGQVEMLGDFLERFGARMGIVLVAPLVLYIALKYWQRQRLYRELRIAKITPAELKQRVDAGAAPIIVDVRSSIERLEGGIPGAIAWREDNLDSLLLSGADAEYVLYCSCPNEVSSARIALRLKRLGIQRVRPLEGGFPLWRKLGYPVEIIPLPSGAPPN